MCVRTKTSYGCGCEYKTTNECQTSRCQGLERYHYPKNGDCRGCKSQGANITRGRDGQGRYGQEIRRRSYSSGEDDLELPADFAPDSADVGVGISPWASPLAREKDWLSRSRRTADDRWLEEHSERNFDLQSIRDELPSYTTAEVRSSPIHAEPERMYVSNETLPLELQERHERRYRREGSGRSLPYEIRSISIRDDHDHMSQIKIHRRPRQASQESFESSPSSRSSNRKRTYTVHDYPDLHDSGYGSYSSHASKYGGAKTEPYPYSPQQAPRLIIKTPAPVSYSRYDTGYSAGAGSTVRPVYGYSPQRY